MNLLVLVQYYDFIKHLWNVCYKFCSNKRHCAILLQKCYWVPKTGGSSNVARCRCQLAPSILQKSGGPCPQANNASLMPYLCSRFYADIKSDFVLAQN